MGIKASLTAFLALVLLALAAGSAVAERTDSRVALLIGNADYPDAGAPLKDVLEATRSLAEELKRQGFDVELAENLTRERLRAALEQFYAKIKPGSTALLFFSGYGLQSNRQTYMVPVNAQIWTEQDVRRDAFNLDSILAEMHTREAHIKIAILDASRRNPFERRFRPVSAGLAPVVAPHNTVVLYAAAPSTVVRENDRPPLFVAELLKELRSAGKIEEVFRRTAANVSRQSNGEQTPWFSSVLTEEFSFGPSSFSQASAPNAAASRPETKPAPIDPEADARREYDAAERIGTRQAWQDFLAKYPTGRYSNLARDRIAKIDTPSSQAKAATPAAKESPSTAAGPKVSDPVPDKKTAAVEPKTPAVEPKPAPAVVPESQKNLASPAPSSTVVPEPPAKKEARLEDPAIQQLDQRINGNPNDAAAYYKRGQLYAQRGDFSQALKDFDQTLRLTPRDPEALNNRCWTRAVLGELQPALQDCDEALQIKPRYLDALDSRGFIRLKLGQFANAVADYDAALRINPKHASSLYGRGIAKSRMGGAAAGSSDMAAGKAIQPNIAEEFASYGIR